ncbi:MAG: 3-dehydroquinate synthase [Armatimonadetes bacterium]|nr:3-dehydroquinate synthase [Armatimonadota bacterium]
MHLALGPRSYDILVRRGLLAHAGPEIAGRVVGGDARGRLAVVISNPKVDQSYGATVTRSLEDAGFRVRALAVPAGEVHKTLATVRRLYGSLHAEAADRRTIVVALGGGVIGDVAGYVAATYARGLDFVQIPTTLLAQVDSSVGGKVGVNFDSGKNLIGAFHQPRLVLIDPDTLYTLPRRELRSGLAEVIKYGIIYDKAFFQMLSREAAALVRLSSEHLEDAISRSCEIKARVVEQDERDEGLRAILNFGHTVGHALEAITRYRIYRHGEAIAIGMVSACLIGEEAGLTEGADTAAVIQAFRNAGFPQLGLDGRLPIEDILRLLSWDKKAVDGAARFVLLERIGRATPGHPVAEAAIRRALERQRGLSAP